MERGVILCDMPRFKYMISILPIRKIITTQICPEIRIHKEKVVPGENQVIVHAVEFDVLQSPPFIKPLWHNAFLYPSEVGCMIHPHINSIGKLFNERNE